jgi:hypothetical protein
MRNFRGNGAFVGVSDHAGWAVLMTVAHDGTIFDRRRIELLETGLPNMPIHHEAQSLPLAEAEKLVECVRVSASQHARSSLDALAKEVSLPIQGIALRECPPLPATIADCIRNYRARNMADWVMYRKAMAQAAEARGWRVHWYDARTVFKLACKALRVETLDDHFAQARKAFGLPWNADHKLATAAAIAAAIGLGAAGENSSCC